MKTFDYLEDYAIGEKLTSPARTITEADIVNFAMITGDWYAGHINAEYAKTTIFGQRFAHGMLTLTLGSGLMMWTGPNTYVPSSFIAFVGLDEVRITKPLFIGDTIHCEATVFSMTPVSKGRGILTFKGEVKNQKDEVLCSYKHSVMVLQRPK